MLLFIPNKAADYETFPTYEIMASEKYDGIRALWSGRRLFSKAGNDLHAPDWFLATLPGYLDLDGELWLGNNRFQGLVRTVKTKDNDWHNVVYKVFDTPLQNVPFWERQIALHKWLNSVPEMAHVELVQQSWIKTPAELHSLFAQITSQGGEGLILRNCESSYRLQDKNDMLKLVQKRRIEVRVQGYTKGKGRNLGRVGALICKLPNGLWQNISGGLSDELRENPPIIGTKITVEYVGTTDAGRLKRASFISVRDYE